VIAAEIQIQIWRFFYAVVPCIRKDQPELGMRYELSGIPIFSHTSESVLSTEKTKVRPDLSDESTLAPIKARVILLQRRHHIFNFQCSKSSKNFFILFAF